MASKGVTNIALSEAAREAPDYGDVAAEVLGENEEKFRIAFDNAPLGMSIIRADGQYLEVNPALCKMFGYSKEEMLSGTINRNTHPDDIERGNAWVKKMISGDNSEPEFEKRYFHKDGHIVWALVRAQWVRNEDGSPRMSIVHILDITERKRAEQAIMARCSRRGRLSALGRRFRGGAHAAAAHVLAQAGDRAARAESESRGRAPGHDSAALVG